MSKIDVADFFRDYVYGFMRSDIQKQLDLAQSGKGGANVLAALGLIVYTEALGRIRVRNGLAPGIDGGPTARNFNACFDLMGYRYPKWRADFHRRTGQATGNAPPKATAMAATCSQRIASVNA